MVNTGYFLELDVSPALNGDQKNYYHNFIGIFSSAVDFCGNEIHVEVSLIYCYLYNPLRGHLDQSLHIFSYLKQYYCSKVVFYSITVVWSNNKFNRANSINSLIMSQMIEGFQSRIMSFGVHISSLVLRSI